MTSLSVSIVTYRSDAALFDRTLSTLYRALEVLHARMPEVKSSLYIVENESRRQVNLAQVKAFLEVEKRGAGGRPLPVTELMAAGSNLGYGRGHNLAIARAQSDYHLILNPDVALNEEALSKGVAYLESHPDVVMAGPRGFGRDGGCLHLCKRNPSLLDLFLRGFTPARVREVFGARLARYEMHELTRRSEPVGVPILSGCFLLCKTEALRSVGGFDERFFLYFEDFDLSIRMRQAGNVIYLPDMKIVHYGGSAARKGLRHVGLFAESAFKFFTRYGWKVA